MTIKKNYIEFSREYEYELIQKSKDGDFDARNILINNNSALVSHIARNLLRKNEYKGLDFNDLFQEGILGIIKSIETFDFNEEVKFSTHAYYWIVKNIELCIEKNDAVPKPTNYHGLIFQINRAIRNLTQRQVENISSADIANELKREAIERNKSRNKPTNTKSLDSKYTIKAINDCIEYFQPVKSINFKLGDDDKSEYEDFIENEIDRDFFNEGEKDFIDCTDLDKTTFWLIVDTVLEKLSKNERFIIENRFEINGKSMTNNNLATHLNITENELKRLESGAINKIKKCGLLDKYYVELCQN